MFNNSRVLKIAYVIIGLALFVTMIMGVATLFALVHWHISPDSYNQIELTNGFNAGYGISGLKIHLKVPSSYAGTIFIGDLNSGSMYWLFLRAMIFISINILVLFRIGSIIRSIKSLNTFYNTNISNLKSIGTYLAIAAFVSFFNFGWWQGELQVHFAIPWTVLLLSFFSFVLAEVFAEGKQLLEDKNMII